MEVGASDHLSFDGRRLLLPSGMSVAETSTDSDVTLSLGGSISAFNYLVRSSGGTVYADSLDGVNASYQGTDSVTVFQNAINALQGGAGGGIQFRGQFTFSSGGITTYPGIALCGVGPGASFTPLGSTIKSTYNGPVITVEMDATNNRQSFPYFYGFNIIGTVDGTCPNQDLFSLVDTPGTLLDMYMDHVMVFWAGRHGLNHNSVCKSWISNCYFEDCGKSGVGDGINQTLGWVNLIHSYVHGNQGRGIFSSGSASGLRVRSCDLNSNVGSAIFTQALTNDFLVVSNRFSDNGSSSAPQINVRTWNMMSSTSAGMAIVGNVFQEDRAGTARCSAFIQTGGSPINARGLIEGNAFIGTTNGGTPVVIAPASTGTNKLIIKNNQGLNDTWGGVATPFATSTVGIEGSSAAPSASTAYTVSGTDLYVAASGGTGVSITIKDPAGNTLQSGLATYAGIVPVGYSINFGAFSVAPTLQVSVV
jgi:hypothetical protein